MRRLSTIFRGSRSGKVGVADLSSEPPPDEPWGPLVLVEGENPTMDIIAIHGLNGHRERTWTHSNGTVWLKDLLPKEIPFARIITYGYDSRTHTTEGYTSQQSLNGHSQEFLQQIAEFREYTDTARRPIIFIVHSLGGVVVKGALVYSHLSNQQHGKMLQAIKISTHGIIFLGTPHEGSEVAGFAQHLLNIAKIFCSTNSQIVKELKAHSSTLEAENARFNEIHDCFIIRNCFEAYPTKLIVGGSQIVVPKWSAAPQNWNTTIVEILRDHVSMGKFSSERDPEYTKMSRSISLMSRDAADRIKQKWTDWEALFSAQSSHNVETIEELQVLVERVNFAVKSNLPLKSGLFVGRELLLDQMDRCLHEPTSERALVVYGAGGIGKTELVIKYAWDHEVTHTCILWFDASTQDVIRASFQLMANNIVAHYRKHLANYNVPIGLLTQYLELKDVANHEGHIVVQDQDALDRVAAAVNTWLTIAGNHRWLAIYDSYEPENFQLQNYIPKSCLGSIIITTRRRFGQGFGSFIEVPVFSPEDSLKLLLRRSKSEQQITSDEKMSADLIIEILGNFPLAIDHAGACIMQDDLTIDSFLGKLKKNMGYILQKKPLAIFPRYEHSLSSTWEISLSQLEKKHSRAANLLNVCSFFANNDLPVKLFLRGLVSTQEEVDNDFNTLLSFSMIKREHDDSFRIHPLVHVWLKKRLDLGMQRSCVSEALRIAAQAVTIRQENELYRSTEDWMFERRIRAHIDAIINVIESMEASWDGSESDLATLVDIADLQRYHGRYGKAERLYIRALQGFDPLEANASQRTLDIGVKLARLYRLKSRLDLAIPLYRRFLITVEASNDNTDLRIPRAQIALAVSLHKSQEYAEAESLLRCGIETLTEALGSNSVEVLSAKDSLATAMLRQDDQVGAEALYKSIIAHYELLLQPDNPIVLRTKQNLAYLYMLNHDYKAAKPILEKVFKLREKLLSLENPSTLRTWHNLAYAYWKSDDLFKAESMYIEIVDFKTRILGSSHYDTLHAKHELALISRERGRTATARRILESALSATGEGQDARVQLEVAKMQGLLQALKEIQQENKTEKEIL